MQIKYKGNFPTSTGLSFLSQWGLVLITPNAVPAFIYRQLLQKCLVTTTWAGGRTSFSKTREQFLSDKDTTIDYFKNMHFIIFIDVCVRVRVCGYPVRPESDVSCLQL